MAFKPVSTKIIKNYFKDIMGATNIKERKVEDIIIRVTNFRAKYMVTKPNHHSQKVLKQDDKNTWFSFKLKVNNELTSFLLSFGSDLIVEQPKCLVEKITEELTKTINGYQT
jgi:predicted DNA-binding transcriptional regulator YafY